MNPTFKRWLICILLRRALLGLAHVHAVDTTPAPGSSSARVDIPVHAVSKPPEFSVKKTAILSQVKTGLKLVPLRIAEVELMRRDFSESIRLQHAELGNSRGEDFSKSSQKGASGPVGAGVWVFLRWPGTCLLGE